MTLLLARHHGRNQSSFDGKSAQSDSSDVSVNGQEFILDPGKDYILKNLALK